MRGKVSFLALALLASGANAANLLSNPGFSGTNDYFFGNYPGATFTHGLDNIPGWTLTGYGFLSYPGIATLQQQQGSDQRIAGGPSDATCTPGSCPNGFVDDPKGLNFIAIDGDPDIKASVSQTLTGLHAGSQYAISFDWAAAQQHEKYGATTDQLIVSLGSETHSTAVVSLASHGFVGWMHETFRFTATSSSEVLQFLSNGTPSGLPPMALLSGGLSADAVPEPAAWMLMITGFGLVGIAARRRANALAA